jgi:hypothetical protein
MINYNENKNNNTICKNEHIVQRASESPWGRNVFKLEQLN